MLDKQSNKTDFFVGNKNKRLLQLFYSVQTTMILVCIQQLLVGKIHTTLILAGSFVILFGIYFLIKKNYTNLASHMLLLILTSIAMYLMWKYEGIHDSAVLVLPTVLILAVMLNLPRLFFFLYFLIILSILLNGYFNDIGWVENIVNQPTLNDAFVMTAIISVISFSVWLMLKDLQNLLTRLSQEVVLVKESKAEIDKMLHHDSLTGLPNRFLAKEFFNDVLLRARRTNGLACVIFLDLDHFKHINDSFGHQVGDEFLKHTAGKLKSILRQTDRVCRHGGDEFLIILEVVQTEKEITHIISKISEQVAKPFLFETFDIITTCSLGVAIAPNDGNDFNTLLKKADLAMYHSKHLGRNGFNFYNEALNKNLQEHMELVSDLHKALEGGQFFLCYQPKFDFLTGEINSAEALIRWNHPQKGVIGPDVFIPVAESSGLIVQIGQWVIDAACEQCKKWQEFGFYTLGVSVNVSAVQFQRDNLEIVVEKSLSNYLLPANKLELEITETVLVSDTDIVKEKMAKLRALGVKFSIDDFGTGYSNLNYLKNLEVETLKIDQSFVKNCLTDEQDRAIINAIVQMANSLQLKTVAEGVEEEEVADFLKSIRCGAGQGFYWSKPLNSDEFIAFLYAQNNSYMPKI
ncbi:putative bifunctional diguanylate cyclase/phosphodiesterase [Marinicellulosiphila megalodicopiae]|uniref:putative bifunctional diguanylate cyclase/phosphodiesterase n=1 Tax=Marinicellulosiphila megalodicopiae TaxID=2724896 RepID=UPI003BB12485